MRLHFRARPAMEARLAAEALRLGVTVSTLLRAVLEIHLREVASEATVASLNRALSDEARRSAYPRRGVPYTERQPTIPRTSEPS